MLRDERGGAVISLHKLGEPEQVASVGLITGGRLAVDSRRLAGL